MSSHGTHNEIPHFHQASGQQVMHEGAREGTRYGWQSREPGVTAHQPSHAQWQQQMPDINLDAYQQAQPQDAKNAGYVPHQFVGVQQHDDMQSRQYRQSSSQVLNHAQSVGQRSSTYAQLDVNGVRPSLPSSENNENQNMMNRQPQSLNQTQQFEQQLHAQAAAKAQAAHSYQVQMQQLDMARRFSQNSSSTRDRPGGVTDEKNLQNFGLQQRLRSKDKSHCSSRLIDSQKNSQPDLMRTQDRHGKESDAYGAGSANDGGARTVSTGKNFSQGSSSNGANGQVTSGGPQWIDMHTQQHQRHLQASGPGEQERLILGGIQIVQPAGTEQKRADSSGPTQTAGLHSSGGSIGAHSYRTVSGPSMVRSRTQGRINGATSHVKRNKLQSVNCPCFREVYLTTSGVVRGKKQPILFSSESTANCGHCGQFFAVKESVGASAKKGNNQLDMLKTVRERGTVFKLDQPVNEIFSRMREVSKKYLEILDPNSFYLTKRIKRIDNLSYIADVLQSDNQTIHHAVHLMDLYSSKVSRHEEYNADLIITTEGKVLEVIDWQLMNFPLFDYVRMFISQGCLFEHERLLPNLHQEQPQDFAGVPTEATAENFKKFAEFFTDFCLYQETFMRVEPYKLACAIVAYTRKYMGVSIIWRHEMELLTRCTFNHFRDLYFTIENKYKENFPQHANLQNFPDQVLTEPVIMTTQTPYGPQHMRRGPNGLLSSDDKQTTTNRLSQNSSNNKQGATINTNITNMFGDLKTPDKVTFDFNSVVSENKNVAGLRNALQQAPATFGGPDGYSHDKSSFMGCSSSMEKQYSRGLKKAAPGQNQLIGAGKAQMQMVFSDNKRQSINAHSFKKQILKNQINNTLSDEKKVQSNSHLLEDNFIEFQRMDKIHQRVSAPIQAVEQAVTSPSANIGENENEQEVPPAKPMIIKSNSQAINAGGYECKTTTKKSPKGIDLEKINSFKDSVNITAKLPSSTTNQSAQNMSLKISNSFHNGKQTNAQVNLFSSRKSTGNFSSNLGFGVRGGPIKISQKINIVNSSSKKKKNPMASQQTSDSSKKLKVSKSYIQGQTSLQSNTQLRANLSKNLSTKIEKKNLHAANTSALLKPSTTMAQERGVSCNSTNQTRTNASFKASSYISGKPSNSIGGYVYQKPVQQMAQTVSGGFETSSNGATSHGGRSVLSIKNAAEVIKRKGSFQGNGNACELRVNINKAYQQPNQGDQVVTSGAVAAPVVPGNVQAIIPQVRNGKNIPNGLLRRATGGQQGRQKSIGALSNYQPNGNQHHKKSIGGAIDTSYPEIDSQNGSIGRVGLLRNESIEEMRTHSHNHSLFKHKNSGPSSTSKPTNSSTVVNPPMIIQPSSSTNFQQAKTQGNSVNTHVAPFSVHVESMNPTHQNANQSSLSSTKNTLLKMAANARIQSTDRNLSQQMTLSQAAMNGEEEPNKPIAKLIKSGSQVLGKFRTRVNMSKREMLQQLNEKKAQMSAMVEAAHATRPTSNERSSTKKGKAFIGNQELANLSIGKDNEGTAQQLYTQKYQGSQRFEMPTVSQFDLAGHESRSEERPQKNHLKKKVSKRNTIQAHQTTEDNAQLSAQVSLQNLKAIENDVLEMQRELQRANGHQQQELIPKERQLIKKKKFQSSYDVQRGGGLAMVGQQESLSNPRLINEEQQQYLNQYYHQQLAASRQMQQQQQLQQQKMRSSQLRK